MKRAAIRAIEYHLPEGRLTNEQLGALFPEWPAAKIEEKTGIFERRVAAAGECSSDLAVAAARKLFASGSCRPEQIDYLIFCTQSPDYFLPTTACLIQHCLGLPTACGALDFNLGCSGYVYGLGLAKGLIESGQATNVLFLTGETYSKFIHPGDRSVRTLFGDAGSATLVQGMNTENGDEFIGPFVFGTDGTGAKNLIVPTGGMRNRAPAGAEVAEKDAQGNVRSPDNLYMNGSEIFAFTLKAVPQSVNSLLQHAGKRVEDIDLFIFHQANQYMLDYLRAKMKLPAEKFYIAMRHCGNTVSSTIPIALRHAIDAGKVKPGHLLMLVGFGVGYSWGANLLRWIGPEARRSSNG